MPVSCVLHKAGDSDVRILGVQYLAGVAEDSGMLPERAEREFGAGSLKCHLGAHHFHPRGLSEWLWGQMSTLTTLSLICCVLSPYTVGFSRGGSSTYRLASRMWSSAGTW